MFSDTKSKEKKKDRNIISELQIQKKKKEAQDKLHKVWIMSKDVEEVNRFNFPLIMWDRKILYYDFLVIIYF